MNIKLITSTIENAKIQEDIVDFISAIFIFFAVKKQKQINPHICCDRIFFCITRFKDFRQ